MQAKQQHHRLAFTLVELLAVLAIVGMLVGLLLPTLAAAREKRNRVACASNLRQIGIGLMAYASDNSLHLPDNWGKGTSWDAKLMTKGYVTANVLVCPSDKKRLPDVSCGNLCGPVWASYIRSYAINAGASGFWMNGMPITSTLISNATETVLAAESWNSVQVGCCEASYFAGTNGIKSTHSKIPWETNYLFFDGHVAWVNNLTASMFP